MNNRLEIKEGSGSIQTITSTADAVKFPKMYRLKKITRTTLPVDFVIDLLNSMEISVAGYTEVYKNWPEMFEDDND